MSKASLIGFCSSGDLSFSSDSKQNINNILKDNENNDINIDINKYHKKKKVFSSKSKSSHSIFLSNLDLSSRHSGKERKKTKQKSYSVWRKVLAKQ